MEVQTKINKFKEFFEMNYLNQITQNIRDQKNLVAIDFNELAVYNPELAELIIGKQRNGPTGIINLNFIRELTRFEDYHDS